MRRLVAASIALGLMLGNTAYAATPNLLWERFFPESDESPGRFVGAFDSQGNIVVIGNSALGEPCFLVSKNASRDGGQIWQKSLCGPVGFSQAVALDASDNVYVTGSANLYEPNGAARTIKLSRDGAVLWDVVVPTPGDLPLGGLRVAPDGNGNVYVAVAGSTRSMWVVRYTTDGTLVWSSIVQPFQYIVLASHSSGDVFVAGTRYVNGERSWSVSRLRSSDGREAWRVDEPERGGLANAIAVDSRGNPVVTGGRNYPDKRIMKTVKYDAATGARLWTRELETAGDTRGLDVAIGANDDVVVTGSDGHMKTVKYRSDGTTVWEASYRGMNGADGANSVSIDAAGDVIVTGYLNYFVASSGDVGDTDARTVKYSGRDGSLVWSVGYDGNFAYPTRDFGQLVRDVGDGVIAVAATWNAPLRVAKYGYAVRPVPSAQGLWWNSGQSGWGLNIAHQGDKLFATWFTYDGSRRPTWWVMPDLQNQQDNRYSGFAYRMRGPAFSATPFASAQVAPIESKLVWMAFSEDLSRAHMSLPEIPFSVDLTRLQFASPSPDCRQDAPAAGTPNYQDLWWNPAESGWGLNLAHQGDILFATWFTYGDDGAGTWFVASNLRRQPDGSFSGSLEQATSGSSAFSPWNPDAFAQKTVGSAAVAFTDSDHGVFRYVVNGISQQKSITRLSFASPATRCH